MFDFGVVNHSKSRVHAKHGAKSALRGGNPTETSPRRDTMKPIVDVGNSKQKGEKRNWCQKCIIELRQEEELRLKCKVVIPCQCGASLEIDTRPLPEVNAGAEGPGMRSAWWAG